MSDKLCSSASKSTSGLEVYNPDRIKSNQEEIVIRKSEQVLAWVRRKIASATESSSSQNSSSTSLGSELNLVNAFRSDLDPDDLEIETVNGGLTNISFHIFDRKRSKPQFCQLEMMSSQDKYYGDFHSFQMVTRKENDGSSPPANEVFVKVAMPYQKWDKSNEFPVCRIDQEYRGLELLSKVCPGATTKPLLCDGDDFSKDGSRYLVSDFIQPSSYELYLDQFRRGSVDALPATGVGTATARFHLFSRSHYGREKCFCPETFQISYESRRLKILEDIKELVNKDVFVNDNGTVNSGFTKTAGFLRKNPEIIRSIEHLLGNIQNPPTETATYIHNDLHILNIFVRKDKSNSHQCTSDGNGTFKIIDFEMSNWGPAGADLGSFIGSAVLYALAHSLQPAAEEGAGPQSVLSAIRCIWTAYREAYTKERTELSKENIYLELHAIVHETVACAGLLALKASSPNFFDMFTQLLCKLPNGMENLLTSIQLNDGDTGKEFLRETMYALACKAIILGFGDNARERVKNSLKLVDLHNFDAVFEDFMKELIKACNVVKNVLGEYVDIEKKDALL